MNEQTEKLVRDLAEKLGTTTEHLWAVLVRQAPITGTIEVAVYLAWIIFIIWGFRFIQKQTCVPPNTQSDPYLHAKWEPEGACVAWILWAATTILFAFIFGCSLATLISAFFNPEYWAIKQLIP